MRMFKILSKMNMELTKGFVDFIDDAKLHSLINNTREDPVVYRAR